MFSTLVVLAAAAGCLVLVVLHSGRSGPDETRLEQAAPIQESTTPPRDRTSRSRTPASQITATIPGLSREIEGTVLGSVTKLASPANDTQWDSEAVSKQVDARLGQLAAALRDGIPESQRLADLITDDFRCGPLRPELNEVFSDGPVTVWRSRPDGSLPDASDRHVGLRGFHRALELLFARVNNAGELRLAFKVVNIQLDTDIETEVLVETAGTDAGTTLQQSARWLCTWRRDGSGGPLRLTSIAASQFEELRLATGGSRLFSDMTTAAFGDTDLLRDQFQRGMGYWHSNLDIAFGFDHGMQGFAIGDVNGDGLDDLYVCQPAGLVNRCFVRDSNGRLRDETTNSGANWLDVSRAALLLDLDNDADQDLVVTIANFVAVHANDGRGRFSLDRTFPTDADLFSVCAADYDADGDLDIYACGYTRRGQLAVGDSFANPAPYHDANNGAPNILLRNDGGLDFTDVTRQSGMDQNNRRFSYAASWEDYDNDGDADLYVANDFGRNNLYQNQAGQFVDVAAREGVEDLGAGMSVTWGDYDQNGQMDLYVSNMFSSAGNRVTRQKHFQEQFDPEVHVHMQRHARGNSLLSGMPGGTFRDCSREARVDVGRWAWGASFLDMNNDGLEDLYVANGFFTSEDTVDL
jgi:hypothetical protein